MGISEAMEGPVGVAFVTMVAVLVVVGVVVFCRRFCCKAAVSYTAVNHGLDDEEMAFKKSMEAQHGDDIDELFNFSREEELEFDTNELDDLEMLQMYRSNLGLPSSPAGGKAETGLSKDDVRNGGSGTRNGGGEGTGAGTGAAGGAALRDTVREAEDLEALLVGGYLGKGSMENGGGGGGGGSIPSAAAPATASASGNGRI